MVVKARARGFGYNKLRGRIIEKFGSQEKFSEILGISPVTMSNKMCGKTTFSQDDIMTCCDLLEIQQSEIGDYFFA